MGTPDDIQQLRTIIDKMDDDGFDGWRVYDMPFVESEDGGNERDVDEMLSELGRRLSKNGRLEEYRNRQHFTKPSEERRQKRQAQAYRAENGKERDRWRGGVEL